MEEKKKPTIKPKQQKRMPMVPKKPQSPQKFNIFWIYAAILGGILIASYMFNSDTSKEINYGVFSKEMLQKGEVDKIVVYKSGEVVRADVFIKKEFLDNPKYAPYKKESNIGGAESPNMFFYWPSSDALQKILAEDQAELPQKVTATVKPVESAWGQLFYILLPVLLIVVFWMFMMRRMGGGGAGGGRC